MLMLLTLLKDKSNSCVLLLGYTHIGNRNNFHSQTLYNNR